MDINVQIDRPALLLSVLALTFGTVAWSMSGAAPVVQADVLADTEVIVDEEPRGGEGDAPQVVIRTAEEDIRRARAERELLLRREEILRYQIDRLEEERNYMKNDLSPEYDEEFRATLRYLMDLLEDRRKAEDRILQGFKDLWEAQESALAAAQIGKDNPSIHLLWPVEPVYGISATFKDAAYQAVFGLEHKAIDIPALQGTTVLAADDGIVEDVVDKGYGFSYVVVRHDGYATLYGHVSAFYVQKGDKVMQGDPIAQSGGMPGTKGAGNLSTGPHLHFEVITGAGHVNPLQYLPTAGIEIGK